VNANGGLLTINGSSTNINFGIYYNSILELKGSVSNTDTITFNGSNATLKIDTPAIFSPSYLSGFVASDKIDLVGIVASSVSYIGTTLTIYETNGQQLSYSHVSGTLIGYTPSVSNDGNGGTLISFVASLTGGFGKNTFTVTDTNIITNLGHGIADVVKIAAGATVTANLAANWTATTDTANAAATAGSAIINSNGYNVNVSAATGISGWTLNATGIGTTRLTGSVKNDLINGDAAGGLTINGYGGTDTIALGTHTKADTVYLVANAIETITGFGSSMGTIADVLNVTAMGNALAGLILKNETTLATHNSPLSANSSGLVFSHADNGTALTATTAAALFANTQTTGKFAIATGTGIELLIETGVTPTSNVIWEINDTAGVFTAIKLTGIAVVAGHNVAFANFQ